MLGEAESGIGGHLTLTGVEFGELSPLDQASAVARLTVFARVEPSHKSALVDALREQVRASHAVPVLAVHLRASSPAQERALREQRCARWACLFWQCTARHPRTKARSCRSGCCTPCAFKQSMQAVGLGMAGVLRAYCVSQLQHSNEKSRVEDRCLSERLDGVSCAGAHGGDDR